MATENPCKLGANYLVVNKGPGMLAFTGPKSNDCNLIVTYEHAGNQRRHIIDPGKTVLGDTGVEKYMLYHCVEGCTGHPAAVK